MKPYLILAAVWLSLLAAQPAAAQGPQPASLSQQAVLTAKRLSGRAISINKAERSVTVTGRVGSLRHSNHCFFGWAGGTNGSLGGAGWFMIETDALPSDLHQALAEIGKRPGDNLNEKNTAECVRGDELEVTITWPGAARPYRLAEIIEGGAPIQVRFGGNLRAAEKYTTGCLVCLTSCYIAVASNAALPLAATSKATFSFSKLAPPEGTPVRLTFK